MGLSIVGIGFGRGSRRKLQGVDIGPDRAAVGAPPNHPGAASGAGGKDACGRMSEDRPCMTVRRKQIERACPGNAAVTACKDYSAPIDSTRGINRPRRRDGQPIVFCVQPRRIIVEHQRPAAGRRRLRVGSRFRGKGGVS